MANRPYYWLTQLGHIEPMQHDIPTHANHVILKPYDTTLMIFLSKISYKRESFVTDTTKTFISSLSSLINYFVRRVFTKAMTINLTASKSNYYRSPFSID